MILKQVFVTLGVFFAFFFPSASLHAQEVGEVRELTVILSDIPTSGDAIQPNFITSDTSEIFSFNHMTWLDKQQSLFDFFSRYKDLCHDTMLYFTLTMSYVQKEVFTHTRSEGYVATGEKATMWVLNRVVRVNTK